MKNLFGFTLIELLIVMSIVALLASVVGPMTIRGLERTQAKQEMLTMKNWLKKISYRAYISGQKLELKLTGKQVILQTKVDKKLILKKQFEYLFFQPQTLQFNSNGFVSPDSVTGTSRDKPLKIDLKTWVNSEEEKITDVEDFNDIEPS